MASNTSTQSLDSNERNTLTSTYATLCVDYKGADVVELISSLVCLQRVDPGATVHILANTQCREMLERTPAKFDNLTIVFNDSIDHYLQLTDTEIRDKGLIAAYYAIFFDYMSQIFGSEQGAPNGVFYFSPGTWFLRPVTHSHVSHNSSNTTPDFVGVLSTNNQSDQQNKVGRTFMGDVFYVRNATFIETWRNRVLQEADLRYERDIEDTIVKKRQEYIELETKRRAEESKKNIDDAVSSKQEAELESTDEPTVEVPDDFDEEMRRAYRLHVTVDTLKNKFRYVENVPIEIKSDENDDSTENNNTDTKVRANAETNTQVMTFNDEVYINPVLFYRIEGALEFDDLKKSEDTGKIVYQEKNVCMMRKLTGSQGNDSLNAPIHKIVSLFMNDHHTNGNLLTLSSGHKLIFNRAYDADFCGYRHDQHRYSELFEMMEAKNKVFVNSKWLLYPCNSVNGVVQVYQGDDERDILLPYLSGNVHTFYHFELSDSTKDVYAKYNPRGYSKHLKCAERPLTLHRVMHEYPDDLTSRDRTVLIHEASSDSMLPPPPRPTAELDGDGNTQSAEVDGTEVLEEKDDADTYVSHVKALLGSRFARVHTTERLCEALACGTIPIITKADGVDVANYEDPLVEGNHYLFLSDEADIDTYVETYIERLGVGLETQMRDAGRAYYERNCSPDGFFRKLMRRYFD